MIAKHDLKRWTLEAIKGLGGSARLVDVMKNVWRKHQGEIESAGDSFYTWQYDIRWAATELRKAKLMKAAKASPRGVWELATVAKTKKS